MNGTLLRDQFRKQRRGEQVYFFIPKSVTYRVCREPLSRLSRTSFDELRCDATAEGTYLLIRVLECPTTCSGTMFPAEDHTGGLAICFLYDHVFLGSLKKDVEEELPAGTVLVLKEPCLKGSTGHNMTVVVGSPSDVVRIDRRHVLARDVQRLGWISSDDVEEDHHCWRRRGNAFFKIGKFAEAIEAYSVALDLCENDQDRWVLHLNLSAAHLGEEEYEMALEHASRVLESQPENEKALYRTGRAHYQLRNFRAAERFFRKLVLVNGSNRNGARELDRCSDRLKESLGEVDVHGLLYCTSRKSPPKMIDFGHFVDDVAIASVPGKGRGVVATRDLAPETLIVAEKALVSNLTAPGDSVSRGTHELARLLAGELTRNPSAIGERLYDLSSNDPAMDGDNRIFCDGESREPIVDYCRLLGIVNTNSFSLGNGGDEDGSSSCRGLFLFASHFNHSCLCNACYEVYGDVITVRAATRVRRGEEVTLPYVTNTDGFAKREKLLSLHGFVCACALCVSDRQEPAEVHARRDELLADLATRLRLGGDTEQLRRTVQDLEGTYSSHSVGVRTHLFKAYLLLAQALERHGPQSRLDFLDAMERGLRSAGLSLDCLLRIGEDGLPKTSLVSKLLLQYAMVRARAELSYGRLDQVSRWVRILVDLERLFTGGDLRTLRDRFESSELMSAVLQMAH